MGNPDKCLAYPRRIVETQEEPKTWHDSWWVHVLAKLLMGFIYIYAVVLIVAIIAAVFGGIMIGVIVLASTF